MLNRDLNQQLFEAFVSTDHKQVEYAVRDTHYILQCMMEPVGRGICRESPVVDVEVVSSQICN